MSYLWNSVYMGDAFFVPFILSYYWFMGQCAYVEVWNRVTHEHRQLSFAIHYIKLRRKQLIQQKD